LGVGITWPVSLPKVIAFLLIIGDFSSKEPFFGRISAYWYYFIILEFFVNGIKGINTAGQDPTPDGVFCGKPRGMKPFFDLTRSVMSKLGRDPLFARQSTKKTFFWKCR
jgi:hypothetical protein